MNVAAAQSAMLLAVVLDGSDPGDGKSVPARACRLCGAWLVRFVASPGLQRRCGVEPVTEACTNTKAFVGLPCPGAIKAKPLLDALKDATRAS